MPYLDFVVPVAALSMLLVALLNAFLTMAGAKDARAAKAQAELTTKAVEATMTKFLVLATAQARDEATLAEKKVQEEKAIIVAAARGANGMAPNAADVAVQASALLQEAAMQAKTLLETAAVTAANLLSSATADAGKK